MPFGFFFSGRFLRGFAIRPLAAALSLALVAPAHAGWFSHKEKQPSAEIPVDSSIAESSNDSATAPKSDNGHPQAGGQAISALQASHLDSDTPAAAQEEQALPQVPGNSADDLSLSGDDANTDDGTDDNPDQASDADQGDDSVVLLPNVQESDLDDTDTPDGQYSPEELAALGDLWERLRHGFQMDTSIDNDRIAVQRDWYLKNQDYLARMARRANRYLYYTVSEAEKRNLPTELALLPIIESAYDPFAYSHADAAGMWQFIPGTARIMGLKLNNWFDGRRDIVESTRAAYDFLSLLYGKFGDWQLALAAYNAGPGAVQRAIDRNRAIGRPTDFWSLRLPAETRAYVPRFLAVAQIVKSPESFGAKLRPVLNQPFFRAITVKGQVDLTKAADMAGISLKEMYQLNAGFKQQATDPEGPHRLLVPAALPEDFAADIAALPVPQQVVAETYRVRRGDTLYAVARRFHVQPAELKRINNLKSNRLVAGHALTITRANVSPQFLALRNEMHLDRSSYSARPVRSVVYKVRRGDTLGSIARRHGMTVKTLARLNGISPRATIRNGQHLTVKASPRASSRRVASASHRSRSKPRKIHYQVRHGDTLSSISRRYNVSVKQIKNWNRSHNTLHPGQGLVLYVAGPISQSRYLSQ